MDIENGIVTTYKKFSLLSSGVITGAYGQLNLRNVSYVNKFTKKIKNNFYFSLLEIILLEALPYR